MAFRRRFVPSTILAIVLMVLVSQAGVLAQSGPDGDQLLDANGAEPTALDAEQLLNDILSRVQNSLSDGEDASEASSAEVEQHESSDVPAAVASDLADDDSIRSAVTPQGEVQQPALAGFLEDIFDEVEDIIRDIGDTISNLFAPTPPTNLSWRPVCPDTFRLTWMDNASNEQGFRIYDEGFLVDEAPAHPGTGRVTHDLDVYGDLAGSHHFLTVTAYNQSGESRPSNQIFASHVCEEEVPPLSDSALLLPVNLNRQLQIIHGYNDPPPGRTCVAGRAPDHCGNQRYGLDLLPLTPTDRDVLAPLPGRVGFVDGDCVGITARDGLNVTLCHLSINVSAGMDIQRGQLLGTRFLGSHIHMNIDDRRGPAPYEPVPFAEPHTLEGRSFPPNDNIINQYGADRIILTSTNVKV